MSEFIDIESEIEARIVKGLRTLMSLDDKYTYDVDNSENSKVVITGSKPRDDDPSRPHIYIDNVAYAVSDVSLNQGYNNDIIDGEGRPTEKRVLRVDYTALMVSMSKSRPQAKNVANRVVDWVRIKGYDFFDLKLGLKINRIRKSQGNKFRASENKEIYSENISLEGMLLLEVAIRDIDLSGILEKIILNYELKS